MILNRRDFSLALGGVLGFGLAPNMANAASFSSFIASLAPQAAANGIGKARFVALTTGLEPDAKVIGLSKKQSEFSRPFWDYIESAASGARIAAGLGALRQHRPTLEAVAKAYGVDDGVIAGIWGMESNFGASQGDRDVLRSVASLAFAGYRRDFYIEQFIAALMIIEQGHVARDAMFGSWAGAMGQTQFMPASFLQYAADGDGDGRKDIWSNVTDALASAANHLKLDGWVSGLPWGFEVEVPEGFDWTYGDRMARHDFGVFAKLGLTRTNGRKMPRGAGGLFLPTGINGPAFLITDNFEVIRKYNTSDAYALGVGHLGDRLTGGRALAKPWPKQTPQLSNAEMLDIQKRLKARGLPQAKLDGKIGWQTRQGVQAIQRELGMVPDGHPTKAFHAALKSL
jgi:membrane-bound lytic murein transglycosylase B